MAYVKIPYTKMKDFSHAVFSKFGFTEEESAIITDVLLTSDLYGIESHGVQRMVLYYKTIKNGRIHMDSHWEIVHETPLSAVIDNHFGVGQLVGHFAMTKAIEKAKEHGYEDILWLDACEHKYIEEVGTMNVMFVIDGVVVTPKLNGSILHGITRDSVLTVLADSPYKFEERRISIDEVMEAAKSGRMTECFGVGTAAVISPVGAIAYEGEEAVISNKRIGPVSKYLVDRITGIQTKKYPDKYGWVIDVK